MIKEIATLIETETGFMKGSTLQVGHRLPTAPDRCILVAEPGGGDSNFYCPDMMDLSIQVISRGKTYMEAREDAWIVFRALHGTCGWNMPREEGSGSDYLVNDIEAMTTPQYISQDENGRYEFSVNFIFRCEESSCCES
jgi:hypothetical protein